MKFSPKIKRILKIISDALVILVVGCGAIVDKATDILTNHDVSMCLDCAQKYTAAIAGSYVRFEDAVLARKAAEEECFGEFLQEYEAMKKKDGQRVESQKPAVKA